MNVCYLCGQNMVDRPGDYQTNRSKYQTLAIRHEEHIIQNALYGRLTRNDILCEACGGKLADEVDADFCKIFQGITEQLKHVLASRDHGGNSFNRTLKGYIFKKDGEKIAVHVKDWKVLPIKPDYDFIESEQKVKIFCPVKVAMNYQNYVLKELKARGVDVTKVTVEIIDDISDAGDLGIFFSEGVDNFNTEFTLGLNKIATGFAVANGIDRNNLPCTLDLVNKKIVFTSNVVPFYPYATMDMMMEPFRIASESEYPTHTLVLYTDDFSDKKKLVCYVDLFSTFQFYVILNHDYKGENIQKIYYQTIIKQQKPEIDIRNTRMKFLSIVAEAIGVSMTEIQGKNVAEIYSYLEIKYNQMTVSYELDLKEYIRHIVSRVSTNLLIKKSGITAHLSDLEKEILDATPELEIDDIMDMHHEFNRLESDTTVNYRQNFIETDDQFSPRMHSTLFKMIEMNNVKPDIFKTYGHYKFYQLSQFIKMNEPK